MQCILSLHRKKQQIQKYSMFHKKWKPLFKAKDWSAKYHSVTVHSYGSSRRPDTITSSREIALFVATKDKSSEKFMNLVCVGHKDLVDFQTVTTYPQDASAF